MTGKRMATFPVELKAEEPLAGEGLIVTGIASNRSLDRQREVMNPAGIVNLDEFRLNGATSGLPMAYLYEHNEQIGHVTDLSPQASQVKSKALLASTDLVMRQVWPLLQAGSLGAQSIGYAGVEGEDRGKQGYYWNKWNLYHLAIVGQPANTGCLAQLAKSWGCETGPLCSKGVVTVAHPVAEDTERTWSAAAAEKRVRAWAGAEDAPNEQYRSCFLWYDADAEEDFGAYKLLICDVLDGKPQVIFRAVAAAMGALGGGRGGVDIPPADADRIRSQCEKLYGKWGKEPPEKGEDGKYLWRPDEKHGLEANLFGERLGRLVGNAQGLSDILTAWQRAGLTPQAVQALADSDLARVSTAREQLDEVLKACGAGSEPGDAGEGAREAALRVLTESRASRAFRLLAG